MKIFNAALTGLFDLVFLPFRGIAPIWGLIVVSCLAGIVLLWIFGRISDQDAIRTVRNRIRGNIIAIRLFGDDLGLLFRLQGRILRQSLTYMRHALVPLLVTLVPVVLVLIQLNLRFASRPLEPGERTVVNVKLWDETAMRQGVSLQVSEGVVLETPAVRVPSLSEVAWRIRAERPGRYRLRVQTADETLDKELLVGSRWANTSTLRTGKNLVEMLLYPGEAPIDSPNVASIEVKYPDLPPPLELFGWGVSWLVVFFVLSILFGFAFRGVLGVEI